MNLSALFIRRPVMTILVMVSLFLFGAMAYRELPVSDLPNVDFPTIQVTASLPGASPETMASTVATPLERQFTTIAGVDSMSSSSSVGNAQITLQFSLDRDIDAAAQDVQTALARAVRQLPSAMTTPPSYRKVNPADQPILYLALTSDLLLPSKLNEYGEDMIGQRISMVNGVAQVSVFGAQKYAVRAQLDPNKLAVRGIGLEEVAEAISSGNVNLPTGVLYGPKKAFTIESKGQLFDALGYRSLIVAYRNGAPVRLEELGNVVDSVENNKTAAWYVDSKHYWRAVILAIQKQPGINTVKVASEIQKLLPTFQAALPPSVELHVLNDRSKQIFASLQDVKFTLVLSIFLVILMIFVFLRDLPTTFIPSIAVPLSIVGTFAGMHLLGFSLDNLSLMALTLSVGFVVDDAVVMLENIVRHVEHGEKPEDAAFRGSREVSFTILSMTLSLVAVFIPVLFMGGIVGRLFNEFAITIAMAILISGFISLTLTPMLCRFLLRTRHSSSPQSRFHEILERAFQKSLRFYEKSLRGVFRHKKITLWLSLLLLGVTIYLFSIIPKGFLPSQDLSQISGSMEAAQGISFASMVEHQQQAAEVIRKNENVEAFFSSAGSRGGSSSSNSGNVFLRLKPRSERKQKVDEVIADLRKALSAIPGIRPFLQNPPPIRIGGQSSKAQYQVTLQSTDFEELNRFAPVLEAKMGMLPGLLDVTSDLQIKNPQVTLHIDRDKASEMGLTMEQIEKTLSLAYGTRQVSTIFSPNNDYSVILELLPEYQADPILLSLLHVRSKDGALIPLSSLASLQPTVGLLSVSHLGQFPSVTLSFNLKPGMSLSEAVERVQAEAKKILPPGVNLNFQGVAQAFQFSTGNMGLLLLMTIIVIYMVLGILYESFIHPVTILTALPFAALGALLTLMAFGIDLNLYAYVGIIMLIGIVKKNGIIMIDFALETQRNEKKDAETAMISACLVRFRPIMMTTMAALLGTLPLAIGHGAASEARQPLGLAVVGGLLFSQFLTLYVTPVFYVWMDFWSSAFRKKWQSFRVSS